MIALRTSGLAVLLLLSVAACALAAPVAPKSNTAAAVSEPVVKIGDAWAQERITLPDGTVHTQTYSNGVPVGQSAKAVAPHPTPRRTVKA